MTSVTWFERFCDEASKWVIGRALNHAWVFITGQISRADIANWFNKEHPAGEILVFGPSGVGKSTLVKILTSPDIDRGEIANYTESVCVEKVTTTANPKTTFVVMPGQSWRQDSTFEPISAELKAGRFRGVILVLAYGHHTLGNVDLRIHKLFKSGEPLENFATRYLEESRNDEATMFGQLCALIEKCKSPIWLLTVVLKEDLWWNESDVVKLHYASGTFRDLRKKCIGSKEKYEFLNEIVYLSLLPRNLVTGRGEILKRTVAGYDRQHQEASFKHFKTVLQGVISWEQEHAKRK